MRTEWGEFFKCLYWSFSDKQMCALWIKKLCDFATPNKDPGKSARAYTLQQQIRNSYSQRLLGMLESNKTLSRPFDEKPPSGPLKYLVRPLEMN